MQLQQKRQYNVILHFISSEMIIRHLRRKNTKVICRISQRAPNEQ
jgi:hypothetical protein